MIKNPDNAEPIRGDITTGPFSTPMMARIMREFGRTAFGRSSACMEFQAFLKRIKAGGGTCLEIGTYNGVTAALLSQYFDKVVCVSIDDAKLKPQIIKRDLVQRLGINNIEFHDVDTNEQKAAIVNALDFDFCYSDGDHTHDTYTDFDLVKRCGKVLFHEVWPLSPPVWNLVNSLPADEVVRAQYDCLAYWQSGGIKAKRGVQ